MAASCLFVNKAVLIHPSWLSYPHHDRLICIWYDEFLTSSASLLQSLICIWYVEICLCLHPSSESSCDVNQSLAIIYLMDFCCLSLTLHCKDRLYCIWQLVLPIACIWYSNISRHRFKASLVFLPHWHHPSAHSLSRFLFLFLFHLWPLNLLRFRAFFHQQPTSPTTHCLYLIQQRPKSSLVFDAAAFTPSNPLLVFDTVTSLLVIFPCCDGDTRWWTQADRR